MSLGFMLDKTRGGAARYTQIGAMVLPPGTHDGNVGAND
jgi:hypothetical protein